MDLELRIEQSLSQLGGREMGACKWHPSGTRGGGFWACPCGWTSKVVRRGLGIAEEEAAVRHATRCDENWPARKPSGKRRHAQPLSSLDMAHSDFSCLHPGGREHPELGIRGLSDKALSLLRRAAQPGAHSPAVNSGNRKAARELYARELVTLYRTFFTLTPAGREAGGCLLASPAGGKRRHAIETKYGPRGGRTEIQSLLFPVKLWTVERAREWARKNDFRYGDVDVKPEHIRLRQFEPERFTRHRTICLYRRKGVCRIKAVVGIR